MDKGVLVPDDVTIKMVMEWIDEHEEQGGYLLDGFPRTLPQAETLDNALEGKGGIDRAINIKVSEGELVRRLGGRLICRNCQTAYHKEFAPPQSEKVCDECGGELYQRDDDKPEAVRTRFQVYTEETAPLVGYYREAAILREVNGEQSIDEVSEALAEALKQ
jgi:adenylate kinase